MGCHPSHSFFKIGTLHHQPVEPWQFTKGDGFPGAAEAVSTTFLRKFVEVPIHNDYVWELTCGNLTIRELEHCHLVR